MFYEQLTAAHKIFVDSYVDCLNYKKAYHDVYPEVTPLTAKTQGSQLAAKDYIKKAIVEKLQERSIDKTETLDRIIKVIQFDLTDYLSEGFYLDIERLNADGFGWLLKGYKKAKFVEVMLMDKDKALENLAKIHQLFADNSTVNVNINQEISAKEQLNQKLLELDSKLNHYGTVKT